MKEADILFEEGDFWVMRHNAIYYVMQNTTTHSTSRQGFDDMSLAVAYAKYLAKRKL